MKQFYAIKLLFFLLVATSLHAETYYVSPSGSNLNSGKSKSQAWLNTDRINSTSFVAGDSILFEGGKSFNGYIELYSDDKGDKAKPVVVSSYGTGKATLRSTGYTAIDIYNTQGIEVRNLIISGAGSLSQNTLTGIAIHNDKEYIRYSYIVIDKVDISGFSHIGIDIYSDTRTGGFNDISITNSLVHDIGDTGISSYAVGVLAHQNIYIGYSKTYNISGVSQKLDGHSGNGIVLGGVDGALIEYCESYNNGWLNAWKSGGPVGIWGYHCNNLIIQYNESHHNRTGTSKDGGGFDLDGGCTNSIMQYNYSHDNEGPGYLLAQYKGAPEMKNIIVRYNISENDAQKNGYGAIHLWSTGSNGGIQNAEIYNNIVYISKVRSGSPKAFCVQSGGIKNATIRNNIFQVTNSNWEIVNIKYNTEVRIEGNSYWSGGGNLKINSAATIYNSLESWRAGTGQEMVNGTATGIFANPEFEAPGTGVTIADPTKLSTLKGYILKDTSPLLGKGANLKALYGTATGERDFWGNKIINLTKFNIGAYETVEVQPAPAPTPAPEPAPAPAPEPAPAPAPVPADCTASGFITLERWENISGNSVLLIPLTKEPNWTKQLLLLEGPQEGTYYGQRIRGYICPPQTGAYTFYVAGDNEAELWLSTSDDPGKKVRIAYTSKLTKPRAWTSQPTQKSVQITLQAGKRYYIEVLHKQSIGESNIAAAWVLPDGKMDAPISGSYLSPFVEATAPTPAPEPAPAPAPAPVPVDCTASGFITLERWENISGNSVSLIPLTKEPNWTKQLLLLEGPQEGTYYGQRIRGYICPPQTGAYTFYVAGDNEAELWLSTSDDPGKKVRIAYTSKLTKPRAWTSQPTQKSVQITLQAGKRYYIEVLHKQSIGDSNIAAAWVLPDGKMDAPISGSYLSPFEEGVMLTSTTSQAIRKEVVQLKNELAVYPNPISERATVHFVPEQDTHATIEVVDLSGRVVRQLYNAPARTGEAVEVTMEANKLVRGLYFIRVTTHTAVLTQKVFIAGDR